MTHKTPSRGLALRALSLGIATALAAPHVAAQSLPTGFTDATNVTAPTSDGTTMTVNVTGPRAYAEWTTFDVPAATFFNVTSDAGVGNNYIFVNRVTGGMTSTIAGTVNAGGNFWLINPAGIAVSSSGVFNVGGLLLSTAALLNGEDATLNGAAFLNGTTNTFTFGGAAGGITVANGASLNASSGPGAIALIADAINFGGTANAGTGQNALVGARGVSVTFDGNLDAITTLAITEGSTATTAVSVGGASTFSGNKTIIAAAGMTDAAGNVLLNNSGGADTVTFNSGDIVLYAAGNAGAGTTRTLIAGGRTRQTAVAAGASSVRILGNVGTGTSDLDIRSAGSVDYSTNTLQGRDVAIGSSGSVTVGTVTARDDLVIRSQGISVGGTLTSGGTVGGLAPLDTSSAGAADHLQTTRLSGNDMSLYAETGNLTVAVAPNVGDGYRIRAADFFGAGVFTPNFTQGTENTFVITDTAGGFTAANLSSPGRLWIEARNGGNLNVTGPLTSARGDVQLITSGGGNINLGGNVTSGIRAGSTNEYISLRSSGAINQTAGIVNTTQSSSGRLYVSAANGISLLQENLFAAAAFRNSGAGGIQVRNAGTGAAGVPFELTTLNVDRFSPQIAGATTGSGDIRFDVASGMLVNAVPVTTGAGNIVVDGATVVAGATTFTATGGSATFNGTIDGQAANQGDLVINATGTTFNGNVGSTNALSTLTVNGASMLNANSVAASNGLDLDDLTVGAGVAGNATLTTDGALTVGNITANHTGTLVGNGGSVDITSFVGPNASLSLTSSLGSLALGSANAGGSVSLAATGGDLNVATTIDAGGNITADSVGTVRANALRSSGGTVSVTALGTVGGATPGSRMDISSAGNVRVDASGAALLGTVAATGAGADIIAAANGLDIAAANATGVLSLTGDAGGITLGTASSNSTTVNTSGALNVTGPLTTNLLTGTAGGGAVLGGANQIGQLGAFTTSRLTLRNARALTVSGVVNAGTGDASIAVTGGNLEIGAAGQVRGAGVDLSTDANFINASGSDAVVASNRWVIYSQAPAGNVFDNLNSNNTAIWNATRATLAPAAVNANRYVFAFQPRLTLTTGNVSKVYGTDLTSNPGVAFTISGYQPGVAGAFLADTQASVFNGTPRVTSDGFAPRASVNGGPYGITVDPNSLATNSGYAVDVSNAGRVTVTPLGITGTVNVDNKTYDGSTAGMGAVVLNGVLSGDAVGTGGTTFTFADKNAGTGKTVNISGTSLTGADAGNYTLTLPATAVADILRRALVAGFVVDNKTYDGTTTATGAVTLNGAVAGDAVGTTGTAFAFLDPNAGTGKAVNASGTTLTGADAGNYTLTLPGSVVADILQRAITVTADPKMKQVGNPDPALTYTITNGSIVTGDSLSGSLTRQPGESAGSYAIQQGTLNASSNYRLTFVGSTLTITEEAVLPEPPPVGVIATNSFASETTDLLDRIDDRTPGAMLQAAALEVIDERDDCESADGQRTACPSSQPR
ncbi:beta strand repeat-containing protein [Lysobacter korlensis]|uniref:Beta strand repeat-containing protein n=1 Tax=Lysobacter korlensis TaxID=553636 RepID=A0ABV6RLH0_9GAMM